MNRQTQTIFSCVSLGALAIAMSFIDPANAQETQPAKVDQSPNAATVGEVIVTAQRRAEDIQKVPIAVTAISGQQIQAFGIINTQDIQLATPGMVFENGYGFSEPYIRGIGTSQPNPGLESAVASYMDGAYLVRSYGQVNHLLDMSGVEVLKGAQGTLWGRNATGGAILYTTAEPVMGKFSADATAEYGNYQHALGELSLNIPLVGDTLSLRLGGQYNYDTGFVTDVVTGAKWGGSVDKLGRATLKGEPNSRFSASLMYEYDKDRRFANFFAERSPSPLCGSCSLPGGGFNPVSGFYQIATDSTATPTIAAAETAILHMVYRGDKFDVSSISSYRRDDTAGVINVAASSIPFEDYYASSGGKTWAEDLQASTKLNSIVNGMVGVSLSHDESFNDDIISGALVLNVPGITTANTVTTNSYSAFGELYVTPIERLKFTFGLRYTDDDRTFQGKLSPIAALFFATNSSNLTPHGAASFSEFTPRIVVDYDLGLVNLYASWNRGFKEGGFNTPSFNNTSGVLPEKVDYFEGGAKYVSPDRRLKLNAAVFYYKYTNIQVSVTDVQGGTNILQNAASARAYGADLSGSYEAAHWLAFFGGVSLLNAKFSSFPNASVTSITATGIVPSMADLGGATLPRAPSFQGSLGVDLHALVADSLTAHLNFLGQYTSGYDFFPGAQGAGGWAHQKGYGLINISGYLEKDNSGAGEFIPKYYRVGFYINNATDTRYYALKTSQAFIGLLTSAAQPITFGLRVSAGF